MFYQASYTLEDLGSQSLMTHTPFDIRNSLETRCLVKIEGDELSKRHKDELMEDTSKRKRILIVLVYLKLYLPPTPKILLTLMQYVHRRQSVVLNSALSLAKEVPDPPQYCRHFY